MKKLLVMSTLAFAVNASANAAPNEKGSEPASTREYIEYQAAATTSPAQDDSSKKDATKKQELSSEEIKAIKEALSELKYYNGKIDGNNDQPFKDALKKLQKKNQLKETGIADEETINALATELYNAENRENNAKPKKQP